jgi:hypothetical protein
VLLLLLLLQRQLHRQPLPLPHCIATPPAAAGLSALICCWLIYKHLLHRLLHRHCQLLCCSALCFWCTCELLHALHEGLQLLDERRALGDVLLEAEAQRALLLKAQPDAFQHLLPETCSTTTSSSSSDSL